MSRRIFLVLVILVLALGVGQAGADAPPQGSGSGHQFQGSITPADREAAAGRAAATRQSQPAAGVTTPARPRPAERPTTSA